MEQEEEQHKNQEKKEGSQMEFEDQVKNVHEQMTVRQQYRSQNFDARDMNTEPIQSRAIHPQFNQAQNKRQGLFNMEAEQDNSTQRKSSFSTQQRNITPKFKEETQKEKFQHIKMTQSIFGGEQDYNSCKTEKKLKNNEGLQSKNSSDQNDVFKTCQTIKSTLSKVDEKKIFKSQFNQQQTLKQFSMIDERLAANSQLNLSENSLKHSLLNMKKRGTITLRDYHQNFLSQNQNKGSRRTGKSDTQIAKELLQQDVQTKKITKQQIQISKIQKKKEYIFDPKNGDEEEFDDEDDDDDDKFDEKHTKSNINKSIQSQQMRFKRVAMTQPNLSNLSTLNQRKIEDFEDQQNTVTQEQVSFQADNSKALSDQKKMVEPPAFSLNSEITLSQKEENPKQTENKPAVSNGGGLFSNITQKQQQQPQPEAEKKLEEPKAPVVINSLFGTAKPAQPEPEKKQESSLFKAPVSNANNNNTGSGGLFGNNNTPTSNSLFGSSSSMADNKSNNLFANNDKQQESNKQTEVKTQQSSILGIQEKIKQSKESQIQQQQSEQQQQQQGEGVSKPQQKNELLISFGQKQSQQSETQEQQNQQQPTQTPGGLFGSQNMSSSVQLNKQTSGQVNSLINQTSNKSESQSLGLFADSKKSENQQTGIFGGMSKPLNGNDNNNSKQQGNQASQDSVPTEQKQQQQQQQPVEAPKKEGFLGQNNSQQPFIGLFGSSNTLPSNSQSTEQQKQNESKQSEQQLQSTLNTQFIQQSQQQQQSKPLGLFSNKQPQQSEQKKTEESKPGLFGLSSSNSGGLFSSNPQPQGGGGLFSNNPTPNPSGSLFGNGGSKGLFPNGNTTTKDQQQEDTQFKQPQLVSQPSIAPSIIGSGQGTGLLGNSQSTSQSKSLFGNLGTEGFLGNNNNNGTGNKGGLFSGIKQQ